MPGAGVLALPLGPGAHAVAVRLTVLPPAAVRPTVVEVEPPARHVQLGPGHARGARRPGGVLGRHEHGGHVVVDLPAASEEAEEEAAAAAAADPSISNSPLDDPATSRRMWLAVGVAAAGGGGGLYGLRPSSSSAWNLRTS